jgi:cobalamin biosynthesis protein CobT
MTGAPLKLFNSLTREVETKKAVTIMDDEQLRGTIIEQLADLFEIE